MADTTLQGTMTSQEKKKTFDPKRRKAMLDMLASGEDPKFVKFNHVMHGFDEEEADDAVNTFYRVTGKPNPLETQDTGAGFTSDYSTRIREKINSLGAESERNGAIGAVAALKSQKDIEQILNQGVETGPIAGRKQRLEARYLDTGSDDFVQFNAATTAFTANFIKALSGVQVSDKEREFLMNALPSPDKQERENRIGMQELTKFLQNAYEFKLGEKLDPDKLYGVIDDKGNLSTPNSNPKQTANSQDNQAAAWLEANPNDPLAGQVRAKLESNGYFKDVEGKNTPTGEPLVNDEGIKYTGFFQDVNQSFNERTDKNAEILNSQDSTASKVLQTTGQNLGFFSDVVGSAVVNTLKAVTPDFIEKPATEKISELVQAGLESEVAQKTVASWEDFKQSNPEMARNIEATGNIANFFALGLGGGTAANATRKGLGVAATKTGTLLEESGNAGVQASKDKFVQDLVMPVQNKATKIDQVSRTTEKGFGPFKKNVVEPTKDELRAAQEISGIEGVSPKNTIQQNYNVIRDKVAQEADDLITAVSENDFIITKKEVISRLNKAKNSLSESPLIVGEAEKMADKLLAGAKRFINENAGTGSGLLKARKAYDAWVLKQKPKAFDAKAENAFTIANREVRSVMNQILDEKAPNAGVKESLKRQSTLLNTLDNIAPKAAEEANTAIGRAFQRLGEKIGTKNKVIQGAVALGLLGGGGTLAAFATPVAATAAAGYGVYKGLRGLMKPELRKGLGKILKESGHLLDPKDKKVLEELAD